MSCCQCIPSPHGKGKPTSRGNLTQSLPSFKQCFAWFGLFHDNKGSFVESRAQPEGLSCKACQAGHYSEQVLSCAASVDCLTPISTRAAAQGVCGKCLTKPMMAAVVARPGWADRLQLRHARKHLGPNCLLIPYFVCDRLCFLILSFLSFPSFHCLCSFAMNPSALVSSVLVAVLTRPAARRGYAYGAPLNMGCQFDKPAAHAAELFLSLVVRLRQPHLGETTSRKALRLHH